MAICSRPWRGVPALLVLLTFPSVGDESRAENPGAGLPVEECVRLVRGARIARMAGDDAAELAQLQTAFAACPQEIGPVYGLMDYYRRRPELEDKARRFRELLLERLRDPGNDLPVGVVEYLLRNPDAGPEELRAILDNVLRQVGKVTEPEPTLMRIQARLQQRLGQDEAAADTLERLWRQTEAEDLLEPLAWLYAELERWQDAADLVAPRVEKDGRLRHFYVRVLGKLGRYDQALRQATILAAGLAAANPGETVAIGLDIESERGHVVDVVQQPGLSGLLTQLAWDLRDQGRDRQAEELFRALLAQSPDSAGLQNIVLNLYAGEEERRRHADALADAWASETDANVLFNEGTHRLTAGDAAGAIDLLRRAAAELPDLEPAWYNLGMAAYRLEDWATVADAFGRAGELNPGRAQTFFFRGIALAKLDRCGEAVGALERAAALDPGRALAHYYLAACHRKLGNQAAADAAAARYEATRN